MITLPIKGLSGPYRFLSNFFIEPDGTHVEGDYQRAKCSRFEDRAKFDGLSPKHAKALGQQVRIREDWEDVKVNIMLFHVTKKFKDHPDLKWMLMKTEDAWLEETNTWGDTYWGTVHGRGDNILGLILMQVRSDLCG